MTRYYAARFSDEAPESLTSIRKTHARVKSDKIHRVVPPAGKATVQINNLYFQGAEVGNKRSNLLLFSEHYYGEAPKVRNIHLLKQKVKPPAQYEGEPGSVLYVTDDYDGKTRLTVAITAIKVDKIPSKTIELIGSVIKTAGSFFPAFAPFAGLAGGAAEKVVRLIDDLNDNDVILTSSMRFLPRSKLNVPVFQYGRFVVFSRSVQAKNLLIDEDNRIVSSGEGRKPAGTPFDSCSYVVFSVLPTDAPGAKFDSSKARVAELISSLDEDGGDAASSLQFLTDVLGLADQGKKLDRYTSLKKKKKLSAEEKERLTDLSDELVRLGVIPASGK